MAKLALGVVGVGLGLGCQGKGLGGGRDGTRGWGGVKGWRKFGFWGRGVGEMMISLMAMMMTIAVATTRERRSHYRNAVHQTMMKAKVRGWIRGVRGSKNPGGRITCVSNSALLPPIFCTALFGPVAFLGLEWAIDDIMMMDRDDHDDDVYAVSPQAHAFIGRAPPVPPVP